MERLTDSNKEIPTLVNNAEYWLKVYFKLKDYEDLEERRKLIKIPPEAYCIVDFEVRKGFVLEETYDEYITRCYCSNCNEYLGAKDSTYLDSNNTLSKDMRFCPYCGKHV